MKKLEDPLRTLMSMADDARKQVDSLVSQGARTVRGALPELPVPGAKGNTLPTGPTEILAKLPKLPSLPGAEAKPAPAARKPPPTPAAIIRKGYTLRNATYPTGFRLRR